MTDVIYTGQDVNNRAYLRVGHVSVGDTIELDDGFTCAEKSTVTVSENSKGELSFPCSHGSHSLSGQIEKTENGEAFYMGVYRPQ